MGGMNFDEIETEALKLNPAARERLADKLLASLALHCDEKNASEWAAEAARRDRAWDLYGSTGRSAPEVFRDARRRLD